MKLKIILLSIVLLCLFSCKKEVYEKVHPEFVGNWEGGETFHKIFLSIDKNGYADYLTVQKTHISGDAKVSKNKLKIGKTSFTIIDYPHMIDTTAYYIILSNYKKSNWKMGLRTDFFGGRDTYTFYKADY